MSLRDVLCPACRESLDASATEIVCAACAQRFPRVAGMPVLLPEPDAHLALWRGQLGLLLERGAQTQQALNDAAAAQNLLDATRARLRALGAAVKAQVDDVASVLGPALGGAGAPGKGLPRGVVEHIGYLYRDWGWPSSGYRENDAPLAQLLELLGERRLGRLLVLGAGACGLAHALHLRGGATETVAVDIDPYLLVPAGAIVRGGSVRLTEAALGVVDAAEVSRTWTLQSPADSPSTSPFHCVFADGLRPPFVAHSFDTVLTPWFIDQVPRDLPAFIAELSRLLRPGGHWLNQGPLIYPEQTPFDRRYARAELFDLARRHGLIAGAHTIASQPYLVSPLTRRGKIEPTLSFIATKRLE
jgi:SAM-dependent methyltransferase